METKSNGDFWITAVLLVGAGLFAVWYFRNQNSSAVIPSGGVPQPGQPVAIASTPTPEGPIMTGVLSLIPGGQLVNPVDNAIATSPFLAAHGSSVMTTDSQGNPQNRPISQAGIASVGTGMISYGEAWSDVKKGASKLEFWDW